MKISYASDCQPNGQSLVGCALVLGSESHQNCMLVVEKKKKISHIVLYPPPLPSYSRHNAHLLLPSLVIISLEQEGDSLVLDFGFIVDWGEETATVWGSSWFLYDDETYMTKGSKKLLSGKVFVTLRHQKLFGKKFEGTVMHVDLNFDLVVIQFKASDIQYKPTTTLAALPIPADSSQPFLSLDFYSCLNNYLVEPYYFRDNDNSKNGQCGGHYLHLELGTQSNQGVILNSKKEVVGLKTSRCTVNKYEAHVLPMDTIVKCLGTYSLECNLKAHVLPMDTNKDNVCPTKVTMEC